MKDDSFSLSSNTSSYVSEKVYRNKFLSWHLSVVKRFSMEMDLFKAVLILCVIFQIAYAQYIPCNGNLAVTGALQTRYIYWSANTAGAQTSCTYLIKAPADHYFEATIWTEIDGFEPDCVTQRLWVSKGGMYNFADATFYCGNRGSSPIQINSIGNEMSFAVQSNRMAGIVRATIISIKTSQSNCECR
jgi:hypothetical protein